MIELLQQGGGFMVPLLLCSMFGLAIVIERWLYLRDTETRQQEVLAKVNEFLRNRDARGLEEYCSADPCLLTNIFLSATRKYHQLEQEPNLDFIQHEIARVMEDTTATLAADMENHLPMLGTVGNVAPLFGFAGTVTGMISAFKNIAATANPDARTVAGGIQEALITTAGGLLISIPLVISYNYLATRIDKMRAQAEEAASNVLDMLLMELVRRQQQMRKDGDAQTTAPAA